MSRFTLCLKLTLFAILADGQRCHAKDHPEARALAGQLRPMGLTAKAEPAGLAKVQEQIANCLHIIERNAASNGPPPVGLLNKAFEYQPAVGPIHALAISGNLVKMWSEARALGLFDADHKLGTVIQKGHDKGEKALFEYIVPLDKAPQFSRDMANVRLVMPSRKRVDDASADPRDLAYLTTLQSVVREVAGRAVQKKFEEGPKTNSLGQTLAEAKALWEADMKAAGSAAEALPNIRLTCRLGESPAKDNGYRWCFEVEVYNFSRHPTEVEVEYAMLGMTQKFDAHYLMARGTQKVQLRVTHAEKFSFWTKSEGHYKPRADAWEKLDPKKEAPRSYVAYRGAIIRVLHGKDEAARWTSDARLANYLNPDSEFKLDALPKLFEDKPVYPVIPAYERMVRIQKQRAD